MADKKPATSRTRKASPHRLKQPPSIVEQVTDAATGVGKSAITMLQQAGEKLWEHRGDLWKHRKEIERGFKMLVKFVKKGR